VKAYDAATNSGSDASNAVFTITTPFVPPITDLSATQVRTGNDAGSTTKIRLTWTATTPGTTVEVWRKGFGHYPEYADAGGSGPVPPSTRPPGAGWELTSVTLPDGTDLVANRDFYYYVTYVVDGYGTWSSASNMTAGALNYHLGDVTDGVTPGTGDDQVTGVDISVLGSNYGRVLVLDDPFNYLDVGPTANMHTDGRPTPDNELEFEDLVIFALNCDHVSKEGVKPLAADRDELVLDTPGTVAAGEVIDVPVSLWGTGSVQGLSVALSWDAQVVEPMSVVAGDLATRNGGIVFSSKPGTADAVVLGTTAGGFSGEGELAVVRFRAIASGSPGIAIASLRARDAHNNAVTLPWISSPGSQEGQIPMSTRLLPGAPNPFTGSTSIGYWMASPGSVELAVFSPDGRMVRDLLNETKAPGKYAILWDGTDDRGHALGSGLYFVRLRTPGLESICRVTLLK
jgi:hypothetical protein